MINREALFDAADNVEEKIVAVIDRMRGPLQTYDRAEEAGASEEELAEISAIGEAVAADVLPFLEAAHSWAIGLEAPPGEEWVRLMLSALEIALDSYESDARFWVETQIPPLSGFDLGDGSWRHFQEMALALQSGNYPRSSG